MQNQKQSAKWELVFQTSLPPFSVMAFNVVQLAADVTPDSNPEQTSPTRGMIYRHKKATESPKQPSAVEAEAPPHTHTHTHPIHTRTYVHAHTHTRAHARAHARAESAEGVQAPLTTEIENEFVSVAFDGVTGRMVWMKNKEDGLVIAMDQNLHWYESAQAGDAEAVCGEGQQKSGAYIFRPNHTSPDGQTAKCVSANCKAVIRVLQSPLVSEVQQVFSDWATQTVRLYAGAKHLEIEWTVGPVPIDDALGKEVVSRFSTNVSSNGYFLTDSNGRDMLERRRCATKEGAFDFNCRPSVPSYNVTEPVAGNFYPINTAISISDGVHATVGVAVDRAQAGASLVDGQMELMVHRRLLCDDNRGVAEPLNETQSISPYDWIDSKGNTQHDPYRIGKGLVVRGKHYLFLTPPSSAAKTYRSLQDKIYYQPVVAVGDAMKSQSDKETVSPGEHDGVLEGGLMTHTPRSASTHPHTAHTRATHTPHTTHTRHTHDARHTSRGERPAQPTRGETLCGGGGGVALPENVMILTIEKQPAAADVTRGKRARERHTREERKSERDTRLGLQNTPSNEKQKMQKAHAKKAGSTVLVRVAHRFGVGEDSELSEMAQVALADLFCAAHLSAPFLVEELSLSGNQPIGEMLARKRLWRREKKFKSKGNETRLQRAPPKGVKKIITLSPLQIRTFLLHYDV